MWDRLQAAYRDRLRSVGRENSCSTAENGLRDDLLELGRGEADYVFHPC